jgi:hypothetical protein
MPKKVSRDTYPAGLEDCDGRCGAVPEQMRVDRLPEGFAGSLGDYMGDRISGKRTAFCAGPDSVMPVGSGELRTYLSEVILKKRNEIFRYRNFECPTRFRFRALEYHPPFLAHLPQMRADPD